MWWVERSFTNSESSVDRWLCNVDVCTFHRAAGACHILHHWFVYISACVALAASDCSWTDLHNENIGQPIAMRQWSRAARLTIWTKSAQKICTIFVRRFLLTETLNDWAVISAKPLWPTRTITNRNNFKCHRKQSCNKCFSFIFLTVRRLATRIWEDVNIKLHTIPRRSYSLFISDQTLKLAG